MDLKIDLAEHSSAEIMERLSRHDIYFVLLKTKISMKTENNPHRNPRTDRIPFWSFVPTEKGFRLTILGPVVAYEERVVTTIGPKTMVKTRPHFRMKGSRRWHPASRMAEFAFLREHGFRWEHEPDPEDDPARVEVAGIARQYGLAGTIAAARPYIPPPRPRGSAKVAYDQLRSLWEGYGMAAAGHAFEARSYTPEGTPKKSGADA